MPNQVCRFSHAGVELAYEVYGSGPRVLIYLHGLLMDAGLNRRLAADLEAKGQRVILLDLPGHGGSDKPLHASAHRMDTYAAHVVHLLDALGLEQAAVGGMSLGADVTLQVAARWPERLRAMVLEMPVLENATPVAALLFVPLLVASRYAAPLVKLTARAARLVPRHRMGAFGGYLAPLVLEPEQVAAVLHGVLVGPVAPTDEVRRAIDVPTLVIGHRADRLHPLTDAAKVASQLPRAELVQAGSVLELRHRPERLTGRIATFLDEVWSSPPTDVRLPA